MNQPSYYAIIPANVRYDKALPAGAKLMYGEITALSNAKGYCFASNGYFAELYGCTPQAISKWIKALEAGGYVKIKYVGEPGKQERRVSIAVDAYQPQLMGVSTQVEGVSTTVEYNNTSTLIQEGNIIDVEEKEPAQDHKSQILADEMFLETCARLHNLSAADVGTLFDEFLITKQGLGETAWKGYPQMRKNFLFWIPKRPQTKATNNGKQQPARPANGKLVSEETQRRVYAELLHEYGVTGGQG